MTHNNYILINGVQITEWDGHKTIDIVNEIVKYFTL